MIFCSNLSSSEPVIITVISFLLLVVTMENKTPKVVMVMVTVTAMMMVTAMVMEIISIYSNCLQP